jgi:hypothetical protein
MPHSSPPPPTKVGQATRHKANETCAQAAASAQARQLPPQTQPQRNGPTHGAAPKQQWPGKSHPINLWYRRSARETARQWWEKAQHYAKANAAIRSDPNRFQKMAFLLWSKLHFMSN